MEYIKEDAEEYIEEYIEDVMTVYPTLAKLRLSKSRTLLYHPVRLISLDSRALWFLRALWFFHSMYPE